VQLQKISPRWTTAVVAATGPSLTPEVANALRGQNVLAVNDAYRLLPFAQVLYACDSAWWNVHKGCPDFQGEKWSSHGAAGRIRHNDKSAAASRYGLKLIEGRDGDGFSFEHDVIHYGSNSGFQAINLALLMGARRIILVGFDMRIANGQRHFFGDHPAGLRNTSNYQNFIRAFDRAATMLPPEVEILNATPGSALRCFPNMSFITALALQGKADRLPSSRPPPLLSSS
jgi:hypothetical protein